MNSSERKDSAVNSQFSVVNSSRETSGPSNNVWKRRNVKARRLRLLGGTALAIGGTIFAACGGNSEPTFPIDPNDSSPRIHVKLDNDTDSDGVIGLSDAVAQKGPDWPGPLDINGDGHVGTIDGQNVLERVGSSSALEDNDLNHDGAITIEDAEIIYQYEVQHRDETGPDVLDDKNPTTTLNELRMKIRLDQIRLYFPQGTDDEKIIKILQKLKLEATYNQKGHLVKSELSPEDLRLVVTALIPSQTLKTVGYEEVFREANREHAIALTERVHVGRDPGDIEHDNIHQTPVSRN